ncbi:recombinase family protein [Candidatus Pelagibacter bacterium]|jgi:site-specific DNA recombinase|nr:recombinase family protein [Candidatus Pelagibacter bacterium]|tara:strand:+ start:119 stop:787 length:669 start_codon:yes stop_codon:yes gene_type:complete
MTTYFYGRCSADENFEKGSSIATQIERANAYAVIHNLKIDKEISESISGSIRFANRPLGLELMNDLKRDDHIICSALDRFSRNTLDLLQLIEKFKKMKINLHFAEFGNVTSSSAMGSVFVKLLSVFAEFYSKQCSEKQSATKQRMIKENRFTGGKKKFGYDLDQNNYYVPCEKEQQVIRQMQLMRKKGKSYQKVAEEITASTRKKFPVSWVHKILMREVATI